MRGRTPSIRSPYYLPDKQYRLAERYALNYETWKAEAESIRNQSKAIDYSRPNIQTSGTYDPTETAGIEVAELETKIKKIDDTISEVSEGLDDYIRLAVCHGYTYNQLTYGRLHMPLNKNEFGKIKHHFYYELYKKI